MAWDVELLMLIPFYGGERIGDTRQVFRGEPGTDTVISVWVAQVPLESG